MAPAKIVSLLPIGVAVLVAALFLGGLERRAGAAERTHVVVVVADGDNLQYLAFWIAKGAGFFGAEGVDVEIASPEVPAGWRETWKARGAPAAVLPPPMYLTLIGEQEPIVLVANLLQNDPINLVVRKSVMAERKLSPTAPLAERLKGLAGLRIGVAPGPPTRLRALFATQGMDADKDVELVILHGRDQNAAFADRKIDALYCHTPYLEVALLEQDAQILVNQSGGEVPELAMRQIHALVLDRNFAHAHPDVALGMTRAVYRAEKLLHADPQAATTAVLLAFPNMDRRHVETIVGIYSPAVPVTPRVSADLLSQGLALFPASKKAPDLGGIKLTDFVDPSFAERAVATPESSPRAQGQAAPSESERRAARTWALVAFCAVVAVWIVATVLMRRRRAV